ncbi:MAG TPA: hypothetical protein VFT72_12515 [Opitutaceae bacterium]|nr:hypothetical protein [Opitutaceae bacterium]
MKTMLYLTPHGPRRYCRKVAALWLGILATSVVFTCLAARIHLENSNIMLGAVVALGAAASLMLSLRRV